MSTQQRVRRSKSTLTSCVRFLMRGFRQLKRQKAISELKRLDDHLLRDIGITRNDIPRVVDGLFPEDEARRQLLRNEETNASEQLRKAA